MFLWEEDECCADIGAILGSIKEMQSNEIKKQIFGQRIRKKLLSLGHMAKGNLGAWCFERLISRFLSHWELFLAVISAPSRINNKFYHRGVVFSRRLLQNSAFKSRVKVFDSRDKKIQIFKRSCRYDMIESAFQRCRSAIRYGLGLYFGQDVRFL